MNDTRDQKKAAECNTKAPQRQYRVGAVRFFNARPLIYGLEGRDDVELTTEVPARLGVKLNRGEIDVGLVPSIDYLEESDNWAILPAGAIGSAGEVLTVRIFSRKPLEDVAEIACDTDSHTSVALTEIIWRERFGHAVVMKPLEKLENESAVLLIGDKVLGQLGRWLYEIDLGAAWTEMTGLPFVYAFWAVRAEMGYEDQAALTAILQGACRAGCDHIDEIVKEYAEQHGFDEEMGRRYLLENISFGFSDLERQGLERFYEMSRSVESRAWHT